MSNKSKIGNRLRLLREEKKLTQGSLAEMLNIKRQTYSAWERGVSNPDIDTIIYLAGFYNVNTDYLLGRTDIKKPSKGNDKMKELANKEIKSVEDALEIIKFQDGLMLNGKILNDEDKMLLANALQLGMKYVLEQEEKKKEKRGKEK